MTLTPQSVKKAGRLMVNAIDNYEEFMDDNLNEGASDETRANLGLINATVSLAYYRKSFGTWATLRAAFRCWKASRILMNEI